MSLCTLKLMRSSMLRIKDDEIFFSDAGLGAGVGRDLDVGRDL